MLETRITEQYGVKIPFINAGMAFVATAPLARAVCKAGGMGMLGSPAMPPDVLRAAIRDIKAGDPACFGVDIIPRFSGIEHIEVCVTEKVPVVVFFWDDVPDEWLSRLQDVRQSHLVSSRQRGRSESRSPTRSARARRAR
jgi:NAD(P)H-dependent flavin oxidoreductase YrpB (nitropropane dioxygenase family)